MHYRALEEGIAFLTQITNEKSLVHSSPKLSQLIQYFSQLLAQADMCLVARVTPKGKNCATCSVYIPSDFLGNAFLLECAHVCCTRECLQKHCLIYSGNNLLNLSLVQCPACGASISTQQINNCFNGRLEDLQADLYDRAFLSLLDEEAKLKLKPVRQCEVCYNNFNIEDGVTLECDHRYCKGCITQYVEMMIETAQVSENTLKCPNCPQPITTYEIEALVTADMFEKFEKFRLRGFRLIEGDKKDILYHCAGADCEFICIVERGAAEIECPRCHFKCCPQCRDDVHKGISCEEYRQWKVDNNEADKKFEDMIRQKGWVKCPECGSAVQRISGCEFMVCSSTQCQNQTYFCYACGQRLDEDHGAHNCEPRQGLRDEDMSEDEDY